MPTDIDENGHYPIELEDDALDIVDTLITEKINSFNELWKEKFSFLGPVCKMTYEERAEMKKVAWEIYKEAIEGFNELNDDISNKIQEVVDKAYTDGMDDKAQEIKNILESALESI
jgi:hypothetical protein